MKKYFYHWGMNPSIQNPMVIFTAHDRTGKMFDLPEVETITPIGKLCTPKTVEELCYGSVKRIVEAAGSKKIVVTWSGGIDSSLTLAELLKIAPKEQLAVMMNDNSIREYSEYYEKYIKDQLEIRQMDFYTPNSLKNSLKDGIIVTGHLLDPVFGAGMYRTMPQSKLSQKMADFLKEVDKFSQENYTRLIQACPREIVDVKDFFWWLDYALNYQAEQLMWLLEIDEMILDKNLFHFGGTSDWNDYAVSTSAETKYPGYEFKNYKLPLKKQLYEFTKDDEYTKEKIKLHSWRSYRTPTQILERMPLYITTDWKRGRNISHDAKKL